MVFFFTVAIFCQSGSTICHFYDFEFLNGELQFFESFCFLRLFKADFRSDSRRFLRPSILPFFYFDRTYLLAF